MTHQEERNKRFDEKFDYIDGSNTFGELEHVKEHITSEVHLTIEQVEKWGREMSKQPSIQHTLRLVPSSQRELFISEMESHLLSFLTTLKK